MKPDYTAQFSIEVGPFLKGTTWSHPQLEALHDAIADLVFEQDWFPGTNISVGLSGQIFHDPEIYAEDVDE